MIKEYIRELEDGVLSLLDGVNKSDIIATTGLSENKVNDIFNLQDFILCHRNLYNPFPDTKSYNVILALPFTLTEYQNKSLQQECENISGSRSIKMKALDGKILNAFACLKVQNISGKQLPSKHAYISDLFTLIEVLGYSLNLDEDDHIEIYTTRELKYILSMNYPNAKKIFNMNEIFQEKFKDILYTDE